MVMPNDTTGSAPADSDTDTVPLTLPQFEEQIGPGEEIHIFVQTEPSLILIGTDLPRPFLMGLAKSPGVRIELAGKLATAMGHGIVIRKNGFPPVFVKNADPKTAPTASTHD